MTTKPPKPPTTRGTLTDGNPERPRDDGGDVEKQRLYDALNAAAEALSVWGVGIAIITYDKDPIAEESDIRYCAHSLSCIEARGLLQHASDVERGIL